MLCWSHDNELSLSLLAWKCLYFTFTFEKGVCSCLRLALTQCSHFMPQALCCPASDWAPDTCLPRCLCPHTSCGPPEPWEGVSYLPGNRRPVLLWATQKTFSLSRGLKPHLLQLSLFSSLGVRPSCQIIYPWVLSSGLMYSLAFIIYLYSYFSVGISNSLHQKFSV